MIMLIMINDEHDKHIKSLILNKTYKISNLKVFKSLIKNVGLKDGGPSGEVVRTPSKRAFFGGEDSYIGVLPNQFLLKKIDHDFN